MVWDSNYSMWVDWARKTGNSNPGTGSYTQVITVDEDKAPDYGVPLSWPPNSLDFGDKLTFTDDIVFIKPLKLVVMTEDKYNELCKTRG